MSEPYLSLTRLAARNSSDHETEKRLNSSDLTHSQHSSVYDAETLQNDDLNAAEHALKDRSGGTRLCTITEQQSIRTLNTLTSVCTFQGRISPVEFHANEVDVGGRFIPRRRCFSADEVVKRATRSSVDLPDAPDRVEPTHGPPFRRNTPPGFPRWPDEAGVASNVTLRTQSSQTPSFFQRLRHRGIEEATIEPPISGQTMAARLNSRNLIASRHWRPPVSAHLTHRFSELSSHPFAAAQDPDLVAKSRQALRYASESNVPVTPSRVATRAALRSAQLPAHMRSRYSMGRGTDNAEGVQLDNTVFGSSTRPLFKFCRHQLARIKTHHGITTPQLIAHYGHRAASLDGEASGPAIHEIPPVFRHDYAISNLPSTSGGGSGPPEIPEPQPQSIPDPTLTRASTMYSMMSSDTDTPPDARA
ncbi:hypothetical protein Slin15195_G061620 [Septoria linicola]|uniref:Uncharacterized protein n=1 Tax=Septoria linicola TaxID=215465 RepID=A0A9Q9AVG4_9PEZI|nr:hypothetical protein Slin15195_G061620 [Septoria linicola]